MSRQRTGSYFQRQSNISNVDQTPQRRVVLLRTNLWTAEPGRLVWVRFASPPGRLLQRVNYTARASDRSWQLPLSLETRRVCGNWPRESDPLRTKILEHYQEKPAFYRTEPGDHEACPLPQRKDTTHLHN